MLTSAIMCWGQGGSSTPWALPALLRGAPDYGFLVALGAAAFAYSVVATAFAGIAAQAQCMYFERQQPRHRHADLAGSFLGRGLGPDFPYHPPLCLIYGPRPPAALAWQRWTSIRVMVATAWCARRVPIPSMAWCWRAGNFVDESMNKAANPCQMKPNRWGQAGQRHGGQNSALVLEATGVGGDTLLCF